jgi:hypothetical protein
MQRRRSFGDCGRRAGTRRRLAVGVRWEARMSHGRMDKGGNGVTKQRGDCKVCWELDLGSPPLDAKRIFTTIDGQLSSISQKFFSFFCL